MGQYHLVVNLDKFEYIRPHKIGVGLKAAEQLHSSASTPHLLFALTMCSNGRGGGDLDRSSNLVGRWAGDRIAIVGDYAEDGDLPDQFEAGSIYGRCGRDEPEMVTLAREVFPEEHYTQDPATAVYRDISHLCLPFIEREFGVRVVDNGGWANRIEIGSED